MEDFNILKYMLYILIGLIGYIIGSIPFALIIGKIIKGIDIRNFGSGNLGGTNIWRTIGFKWGIIVYFFDILKGYIVTLLGYNIGGSFLAIIVGIFSFIGHIYPIFANFRGGKGVATGAGVLIFLVPFPIGISLIVFIITLLITRYVSLSSILATFCGTILILFPFIKIDLIIRIFSVLIAIFIIYRHKKNIKNLLNGKEKKIN